MITLSAFTGLCVLLLVQSRYSLRNREIAIPIIRERDHTSGATFGVRHDKTIQEMS